MEISINLIDPNPFQPRKDYDSEVLAGIATSSMDELGIRNPPIVRPHPDKNGRFQIASGHGRVSAWKTLGHKTITCRVEKITDSQMKKEVLVENVNRSDLSEEERYIALEQYRKDLGIDINDIGIIKHLSEVTGISEFVISNTYFVKEARNKLKILFGQDVSNKASSRVIRSTRGLDENDALKLIFKALNQGWSGDTTLKIKLVIKEMALEVRNLILEESTKLPQKVIIELTKLKPSDQFKVIHYIQKHRFNEFDSLRLIDAVERGEKITLDVKRIDEIERVFNEFNRVYQTISGWGVNQYNILGSKWGDAREVLLKIRHKIDELLEEA